MVLVLIGCTSVESYHSACLEGNTTIAGQVSCLKANISQDERLKDDTLIQEYLKTGDVLVEQVEKGELSEKQAQLKLLQKLNDIRLRALEEDVNRAKIDRAYRDRFPRNTECHQAGDRIYCTSF